MAANPQVVNTVATFTALRAVPAVAGPQYVSMYVISATNQSLSGNFYWSPASSASDDGRTVIKPTDSAGNGRWLRQMSAPTESNFVVYASSFGAVQDGVTDDTAALQAAIAFFSPNGIPVHSGTIIITGVCKYSKTLTIGGSASFSFRLEAAYTGADPVVSSPCLKWSGAMGFSSGVIYYAGNRSGIDGINFDGSAGGLESQVEFVADNGIAGGHVTAASSAGLSAVVSVSQTTGMGVGTSVSLGLGTPNFEVVRITAVSAGVSITANCQFPHAVKEQVGSNNGSSNQYVINSVMGLPVGATSVGIRYGNVAPGPVSQVDAGYFENVSAIPSSGVINDAYSLFRSFGNGNTANVKFSRCSAVNMQYGFDVTGVRSIVEFDRCGGGGSGIAEILSASREEIDGHETESVDVPCRFIIALHGTQATQLSVTNCNVVILLPSDDIGIMGAGSLFIQSNNFANQRLGSSTFKVSSVSLFSGNVTNSAFIESICNSYGAGQKFSPVFYDGSGNPMGPYNYPLTSGQIPNYSSEGDYCDSGDLPAVKGQQSILLAGVTIDGLTAGQVVNHVGRQDSGWNSVTIPYTEFQTAALTKILSSLNIMPSMMVTKCFAKVTVPFAGPAGTLQLKVGITSGGNELLLALDCKTAVVLAGTADSDLGSGLARATAVQGGAIASGAAATNLFVTLTSSSGNLSSLTFGSVTISLKTERFGNG